MAASILLILVLVSTEDERENSLLSRRERRSTGALSELSGIHAHWNFPYPGVDKRPFAETEFAGQLAVLEAEQL